MIDLMQSIINQSGKLMENLGPDIEYTGLFSIFTFNACQWPVSTGSSNTGNSFRVSNIS